jgi:hypothetical protein
MHATRIVLTATLFLASQSPDLLAYPITPVTLWGPTEEADLVVLADVTDVTEATDTADTDLRGAPAASRLGGPGSIARLSVREVWKGEAAGAIEVAFDPNYLCPAPPRYVAGKTVIAFLTGGDDIWTTVALSYGTHYPAPGDIGDYRDRVREARDLMSRPPVTEAARLDWLVRTASRRATRWDGLYELMPRGDSMHSYYDEKIDERSGSAQLTAAQYQTLAMGFAQQPSADRTLPMILALFEGRPHHALDRAAMAALERVLLADRPPWWIGEAMGPLLRRLGDSTPEARLAPLGGTFTDKDTRTVREIWARAKAELGLPEVPAVPISPEEVWGVGPNTPS